jgi:hypothetical protein
MNIKRMGDCQCFKLHFGIRKELTNECKISM